MAFGPIMRFAVDELQIELGPIARTDVSVVIENGGMQQHTVTQFLGMRNAPVLEDEHEWYDKIRSQADSYTWGIWDVTNGRTLIGTSSLHNVSGNHFRQAVSGSLIFRQDYWGRGIARSAHKARTWYGFTQLGLTRIMSAVIIGNHASQRALERSGYIRVYVERNEVFVNGKFHDKLCLECLNPDPSYWKRWWGTTRPTKASRDARLRTLEAIAWAATNVTLV